MKQILSEQKRITHNIPKILLIAIGILLTANAVCMLFLSNMHIGLIAVLLLGAIFLFYGICLDGIIKKIPKWIKGTFFACVLLAVAFISFLLIYGNFNNATYEEDAVIVLGSGIRGEELTVGLKNRLDAAIQYHENNPDAIIVVSGGQGPQEDITEALAMERYLLRQGVPQDKIIKEEQATSTYENFVYSKQLLDAYFDGIYRVAYITNDYHIYRAGAIARRAGFEHATHCSSATPWYSVVPSCVRECIGVLKFWVFGN